MGPNNYKHHCVALCLYPHFINFSWYPYSEYSKALLYQSSWSSQLLCSCIGQLYHRSSYCDAATQNPYGTVLALLSALHSPSPFPVNLICYLELVDGHHSLECCNLVCCQDNSPFNWCFVYLSPGGKTNRKGPKSRLSDTRLTGNEFLKMIIFFLKMFYIIDIKKSFPNWTFWKKMWRHDIQQNVTSQINTQYFKSWNKLRYPILLSICRISFWRMSFSLRG